MTPKRAREVLNAPSNADTATLARAFRAAVKACHPDREGGDAERLRQVIEAHRILQQLQEARRQPAPQPVAAEQKASQPRREAGFQPVLEHIDITVAEALFGGDRRIQLASGRTLEVRCPRACARARCCA